MKESTTLAASDGVFGWLNDAADSVLSIGGALLVLASTVVLAVALRRAWKQSRLMEVTVETLSDATGDATTAAVTLGLTYRLREDVVAALPALANHARRVVEKVESDPTSPIRALVQEDIERREALLDDITSSRDALMQSMENMVPQAARGAYRVVTGALLRPKEVRVLGVLQRLNDGGGGIGLSFNVNHVGAEEAGSRITLWEDPDAPVAGKTVVERCHALILPAARALACELLRQRLKLTMAERNRRRKAGRRDHAQEFDREAVVELLVGGAYQNAAHGSAPATKSFFELAARALATSDEKLDHYRLSYQRANTLAELGRRQGDDRAKAIELFSESVSLLNDAGRRLPEAELQPADHRAEELAIRAALTVNACLVAELLPDDNAKAERAAKLVCELTTVDPVGFQLDGVLYNVACALAVAARVKALARHGTDTRACLDRARLWLLYAGAHNGHRWTVGAADPDLCLLHAWIPDARRHLSDTEPSPGGAEPPDPETISARVDAVVAALTPRFPPPDSNGARINGQAASGPTRPWRGDALKTLVSAIVSGERARRI
jgi:hypothetical protein